MATRRPLLDSGMRPGVRIGSCIIVRELARGGQGVVYEARDLQTGQLRALKVLLENDAEMRARFRHEARALANLRHPGLPRVFDLGEHRGAFFMVQELIDGEDLQSRLQERGPFPPERAVEIVRALAETLEFVHANGLVHRDLKPGNVVVERGSGRVVLLDFGMIRSRLRQAWATQDQASLTAEGQVLGTPAFMAPEQVDRTLGEIDRRTDVYALGGTLFSLLTGSPPFTGLVAVLLDRLLNEAPPDPRTLVPGVPAHLAQACLRCLAKSPAERPANAREAAALLDGPANTEAVPPSTLRWALLLVPLALLTLSLAIGLWVARGSAPPPLATAPDPPPSRVEPPPPPPEPPAQAAELTGADLRRAAEARDPEAMYRYGRERLYADDGGATEAIEWFEAAAEAGVVPAMNEAGRLYEQGLGVTIDYERGARWCERAAETGDPVGLARFGFALIFGQGAPQDVPRGELLLDRAGEHPEALYRRGLEQEWRMRDRAKALDYYERAGEAGHGDAWSRLAHLLSTGDERGFDLPRAFVAYEKGTELGSCHAIHGLARLYNTEIPGRVRQPERSLELYERSARLGIRDSSVNLAFSYLQRGEHERARRHAEIALSLGQPAGAIALAEIYRAGFGVPRDLRRSWGYLLQGAGMRDPNCALVLCERIARGTLPPADLVQAVDEALVPFSNARDPRLQDRVYAALRALRAARRER